ncbi:MAG TPA: L-glutamate gamma-semialdehyde dehydrogenase [Saprospiraceae bacterium]|nr:L-glutamate gamma-semialdehyde dehydrogenase [Saprospiraceae bacterium]
MSNAIFKVPDSYNEPIYDYAPGSPEKESLLKKIKELKSTVHDVPMHINGKEVTTGDKAEIRPPHELSHLLGHYHKGDASHVKKAIDAALKAKKDWEEMPWQDRAAIFLKAADLISGPYRDKINAATMLCQSKNVYQSEIDAVMELCDFLRFNVKFMTDIYKNQPISTRGTWNRIEHRGLEGFIFAITPFNFTAIAGNLPSAPAMMGNCVVWKPAESQIFSANVIMEVFKEAGLPDGVINLVYAPGPTMGDIIFEHPDFAGLHFTGSTGVFQKLWKIIGNNISKYKAYPRIVGETGGKDFIVAHPDADYSKMVAAFIRGAFEFQGQKCSAASRAYIPKSRWDVLHAELKEEYHTLKMGSVEDFSNFVNAVIDEAAFDKIAEYIDYIKESKDAEIIFGGNYSKEKGYFIEPTIALTTDPHFKTMEEEIFGPVLTVYLYDDDKFEETLELVDNTSPYALTGAVFARKREDIRLAEAKLRHAAGNFYINDKPTGSIVGQQPFGGARGSGTNDKAGSMLNLLRWVSQRTIKETFVATKDYRYPFLG